MELANRQKGTPKGPLTCLELCTPMKRVLVGEALLKEAFELAKAGSNFHIFPLPVTLYDLPTHVGL